VIKLGRILIVLLVVGAAIRAQEAPARSVWDGVYTQAQADRGRVRYEGTCAGCHGDDLEGDVVEHPELAGGNFRDKWNGLNLGELFQRIHRDMPLNKAGSLSREAAVNLVAFILNANAFPAGSNELSSDERLLSQIRIQSQKPPVPKPPVQRPPAKQR
jgi:mono/diheme cytochrome c family protein